MMIMAMKKKKAVLFVPFWRMAGHVGNNRVDRFRRWLTGAGYEIVMICAGSRESMQPTGWGREITIVDRLGLHPETAAGQHCAVARKPNKYRRALAYWLFNPDPAVIWAKTAARHPGVIEAATGAEFILSSSPPDSAHVGAWMLSQRTGVPHIMDMRDGWLDEPLKPVLLTSAVRRWQEGRLESRVARDAHAIQVTSEVWKELFDARYPDLSNRVHVLTNGYPPSQGAVLQKRKKTGVDEKVLVHAGRFTGSRLSQKPELLMEPLLRNLRINSTGGVIRFYGDLAADEVARIREFQQDLSDIGWRIEFLGMVPRGQVLDVMRQADGLLLLSASHAALPSKLFEYLSTGLPIGYVADSNSAAAGLLKDVPQAVDLRFSKIGLMDMGLRREKLIPTQYGQSHLAAQFMKNIPR